MKVSNLFGFLPVTRWKFNKTIQAISEVLNAIIVADAQHTNIEQGLLAQVTKRQETKEEGKQETTHVEFG